MWDTLDAVQNGTPQHFGMPHETWDQLAPAEIRRTVPLVSRLSKVTPGKLCLTAELRERARHDVLRHSEATGGGAFHGVPACRHLQELCAAGLQVPIFKQRRLGEATKDAVATGSPQAVVDAVVKHAMQATRGERELFEIVDVESHVRLDPSQHCSAVWALARPAADAATQ